MKLEDGNAIASTGPVITSGYQPPELRVTEQEVLYKKTIVHGDMRLLKILEEETLRRR